MSLQGKNKTKQWKIWYIAQPVIQYWVILTIAALSINAITGEREEVSIYMSAISMLAAGAFMIYFHHTELKETIQKQRIFGVGSWILLVGTAISVSLCFNIAATATKFSYWSERYQQVERYQYSLPLTIGILFYGILSPVAEEIVFRGLAQSRLQHVMGGKKAIVVSALLFAIYHGNWIQGSYAFLMGLFFAYAYQKYKTLCLPIVLHGAVNLVVFVTSYTGIMETNLVQKPYFFFFLCSSMVGFSWLMLLGKKIEKKRD